MIRQTLFHLSCLLCFTMCNVGFVYAEESASPSCGEENCHGLTVKCGQQPVVACNEVYGLGDKCRRHVQCRTVEGKCMAIESEEFQKCKKCVEACKKKESPDDPAKVFSCEAQCE